MVKNNFSVHNKKLAHGGSFFIVDWKNFLALTPTSLRFLQAKNKTTTTA